VWEIVDVTVFEPIPTFNVTFNVEDEGGNALTDAIVTLNGVSNPAGDYLFEDIEPGFYNYNVELEGYMPGAGEVEVIDQNITVTVYLEKIGQLVNLIEGWSLISSYQNPETNTLEEIFANQLANENLIIMLNQSGFFWPVNNINTLGNWNPYMGYKVKMNAADIVNVKGNMVENLNVELNQGINYLPVLSKFPVEASEVFNQIADKILYVFDLVNGFIYWPAGGLNNLEVLEPGMAYLVGMSNPGTIIFPASNVKAIATQNPVTIINSPWMVEKTGNVHIISIADNSVDEGDIIAAFNSTGRCVGIVQKSGVSGNLGLIVYGDDPTTQIIDGMTEFETMSFRIFKFNTSEIIDVTPVWNTNMPNAGFFTENGLSSISAFTSEANGVSYNGQVPVMIYPNPASSFISIETPDRKISSLEIYDQLGQLIISTPLTHEMNRINITDLRPGIYMVKVLDGNQILSVSKLIVK
ncbi:MAG: T9SS type A sorting domain-containing protein, partial [Sphingobacteriia bacterium]|nr:T9SS type A sorting domain-containing protein [Sphingobacteriia bacterium]